jgi:hypothetical protein
VRSLLRGARRFFAVMLDRATDEEQALSEVRTTGPRSSSKSVIVSGLVRQGCSKADLAIVPLNPGQVSADAPGVRGRSVVLAVLATLAVACLTALYLLRDSVDDEQQRATAASYIAPASARVALASINPPLGVAACNTRSEVRRTGLLCWSGSAQPVMVTSTLLSQLRAAGASNMDVHCVNKVALGVACRLTARLKGADVALFVAPQISKTAVHYRTFGILASGGVGSSAVDLTPNLPRGIPVPPPSG